jgi:cellulose synthase/poly-beta-1,6-N-acetylglucosamine synthase-like glycosyltransferase
MEQFIDYISYVMIALLAVYVRQILFFSRGLSRIGSGSNAELRTITVIIPARNEEANIGRCLTALMEQEYPREKLSIIVIDDQSSDRTPEIVRSMIDRSPFPITLLRSDVTSTIRSPKIRAMTLGIQHSLSEIILTTDADCIASPQWVAAMNRYFDDGVGIVTGLTVYEDRTDRSALFYGIQFLDFISYTAIAAGAIGRGRVLVSNGSNMAFRIQAFDESGGFDTLMHINTGDDSLLAQKIVADGHWKARFAYNEQAVIRTQPVGTWEEVLHQRMRWVGQTAYYPAYMMFFMICTFIMFILVAITIPLSLFHWNAIPWIIVAGKFFVDYHIMRKFTTMTNTTGAMRYFLPTAIIHIPFVLLSTFGGYFFSFKWKDRTMTKEAR